MGSALNAVNHRGSDTEKVVSFIEGSERHTKLMPVIGVAFFVGFIVSASYALSQGKDPSQVGLELAMNLVENSSVGLFFSPFRERIEQNLLDDPPSNSLTALA